jgi:signal transduction histidine kinase
VKARTAKTAMDLTFMESGDQVISLLAEAYASRMNNLEHSIELAKKALNISRELKNHSLVGKSLNHLSLFYMIRGEYNQSTTAAKEAIQIFQLLNDERGIADAKYNIAGVLYKSDNYHLGLTYLIDCLTIYVKYEDYHNISRTEKSLGTIYEYFGDQKSAVKSYENAIEAAQKTNDINLEANVFNNLSGVYLKQGKIDEASRMIDRSVEIKQRVGDTRGYAFAIYGRGKVNTRRGNFDQAEKDYLEAIKIHEEMGEKLGLGMAYNKLGALYFEMDKLEDAKKIASLGRQFSEKYNIVITKFKCDYQLYRIYKIQGNATEALKHLEQHVKEREAVINTQTLKIIENYELINRMKTLENEARLQKEKAEIIEKKNRAEESARIRQEFLSTMSHEIRTPLNAVISIITLLNDRVDPEEKQLLDSLRFASGNLLRIINDILDFTKLDIGKMQLEIRNVALKPLLENIWRTYDSQAKEKGLKLSLKMDINLADSYQIDETKMSQILGNLISNAIKFTDKGRVILEVEKISGDEKVDRLMIKVSDTGEGIPESQLDEIFESFSQTRPITTRKQGGTGLGLAIVKKLVQLHNSEIRVTSEPGKGSEFFFELELIKAGTPKSPDLVFTQQLFGKVALLAEDNQINAFVMRKLLTKWGINTELAVNGKEAVEKARASIFDFILMDIHMPEMNGYDAARNIRREDNPNRKTPIFAITADITAPTDEEYALYFNGFLWKPLQIEKLHEVLSGAGA